MKHAPLIILAFLLVFVTALAVGYSFSRKVPSEGSLPLANNLAFTNFAKDFIEIQPVAGAQALPDFEFLEAQGNPVKSEDLKGHILLINFWAMWCAPCVTELPLLEKLNAHYEDMEVIAMSLDSTPDIGVIRKFLDQKNIGLFAAYLDHQSSVKRGLSLRGIPTTYLIDRQGRIHYIFTGDADWMSKESIAFFDSILK